MDETISPNRSLLFPAIDTWAKEHSFPKLHEYGRPSFLVAPSWLPKYAEQVLCGKTFFKSGLTSANLTDCFSFPASDLAVSARSEHL
jgi:hypothetical protein